jgi:Protein of unknown function (DUF3467).
MTKSMRKTRKTAPAQEKLPARIKDPGFVHRYANTAQIQTTRVDFRIRFGEFEQSPEGNAHVVREVVAISMSPQHAAMLSELLQQSLHKWMAQENEVAEIGQKAREALAKD